MGKLYLLPFTDRDVGYGVDAGGPKEPCEARIFHEKGQVWGV